MNIIGIIAEYNPFHNGHIYQINEIKKMYPNSLIIVILNGNFTQRGDVSIINKWDKTRIILEHNVDLVIELPTYYGINNSSVFAKGAIKILNDLKIDTLVFGTERDNINDFKRIISIKKDNNYISKLKCYLDMGYSYPKACFDAIKDILGININTPNDILALSYMEEIMNNNYNITPVCIKRTNDYHGINLDDISSATAIREGVKCNKDISSFVPSESINYVNNISINDYFDLLKYKININDDLTIFHDVKEGIDVRIKKYINDVNNTDELILKVKNKRFTYNRIKRILLYILLDIKKNTSINDYIRPLGFNDKGQEYLKKIKKNLTLPLVANYSDNKDLLQLERKANIVYSLKMNDINNSIRNEYNRPIKKEH